MMPSSGPGSPRPRTRLVGRPPPPHPRHDATSAACVLGRSTAPRSARRLRRRRRRSSLRGGSRRRIRLGCGRTARRPTARRLAPPSSAVAARAPSPAGPVGRASTSSAGVGAVTLVHGRRRSTLVERVLVVRLRRADRGGGTARRPRCAAARASSSVRSRCARIPSTRSRTPCTDAAISSRGRAQLLDLHRRARAGAPPGRPARAGVPLAPARAAPDPRPWPGR